MADYEAAPEGGMREVGQGPAEQLAAPAAEDPKPETEEGGAPAEEEHDEESSGAEEPGAGEESEEDDGK